MNNNESDRAIEYLCILFIVLISSIFIATTNPFCNERKLDIYDPITKQNYSECSREYQAIVQERQAEENNAILKERCLNATYLSGKFKARCKNVGVYK